MNRAITRIIPAALLVVASHIGLTADAAERILFTPSVMLTTGVTGNRYHTADEHCQTSPACFPS